jgi:hypothetical protein
MGKRLFLSVFLLAVTGFFGGVFSDQFLRPAFEIIGAHRSSGMSTFVDGNGQKRMDIGVYRDQPIQDLYGMDGKLRLQFGTYLGKIDVPPGEPNPYREDEKGLPYFTLSDNEGRLKMVIRLDGPKQGPLIIMKDNTGTNRMIMGLDIWDKAEEPFLVTWDKDGKQHDIIGNFVMKPL